MDQDNELATTEKLQGQGRDHFHLANSAQHYFTRRI
jgi:hypothetical protein